MKIKLMVNGIYIEYQMSAIRSASEGFFIGGFTSPAVLIHRAVPDTLYQKEFVWYDEPGEEEEDYYYCEVRQKNMQFAWLSPVFVREER